MKRAALLYTDGWEPKVTENKLHFSCSLGRPTQIRSTYIDCYLLASGRAQLSFCFCFCFYPCPWIIVSWCKGETRVMRSSSNRQAELYAAAIIPYTAAAVALVLRLASRRRTRTPQLLWEDYLAVVAFVSEKLLL